MKNIKQSVLIVDDDPDILITAGDLFYMMGFEVHTASNGIEAIEFMEKGVKHIDVLFSDVVMPNGVNGISLGRAVRKHMPDIKIILCSGYSLPSTEVETDLNGFAFVKKPYRFNDLVEAVQKCFEDGDNKINSSTAATARVQIN